MSAIRKRMIVIITKIAISMVEVNQAKIPEMSAGKTIKSAAAKMVRI